ncbi:MAG: hypothetical protein RR327_05065 [Clostridia bacterium]
MEEILTWANLIYAILGMVITLIPLGIALFKSIKTAVKDKQLFNIIVKAIKDAELTEMAGEQKLSFALSIIENACKQMNVKFDKADIEKQIENLISLTKTVNVKIPIKK